MNSIIIKYTSEHEQSPLGEQLDQKMIECLKATVNINEETGIKLATLLGINLPREVVMELIRPWYRANMLAAWCEELALPQSKENIRDLIKLIEQLKKLISTKSLRNSLMAMLFFTSTELDSEKLLHHLNEMEAFFKSFINMNFKNGEEYSADYFKRYAINSLFWIGKRIGLSETSKPTHLNQFLQIVTDRLYADINKDYYKFKKNDFLENIQQKMNTPLLFIYDPYCKKTNDILSLINQHYKPS